MTEAEWLAATDPTPMQTFLRESCGATRRKQGRRRLRLFACACVRGIWQLLRHTGSRQALHYAELYADGETTERDLATAAHQAKVAVTAEYPNYEALSPPHGQAAQAAGHAAAKRYDAGNHLSVVHAALAASRAWSLSEQGTMHKEEQRQAVHAAWLRDVYGNPFRPVALDPSWLTSTAVALASQMYESRDFALIPILADALEDAGCDSTDVLSHCRDGGPHVRGCWVVDAVLRKG